jgi:tetratricopeptide (TPR) repeat protein
MARPSFRTKLNHPSGAEAREDASGSLAPFLAAWRDWLPKALLLIVVTLWVFSPAYHGEWLWDDAVYVQKNEIIHDPLGFLKVWSNVDGQGDYYPLTQFVWWIEWQHLSKGTLGYHLTNVAFHLTGAFLLWILLARIGLRTAWVGALIFAVHPVMVESVAWISELKNTLSLPLLLLSMICWLEWKNGAPSRFYRWSLLCYVLSLLAKIAGLMLPLVLLGHAWAVRGKVERKDFKDIAPFFAVMVVFVCITFVPHRAPNSPSDMQPVWSLAGALASVGWGAAFMLGKCLWPVDLLPVYGGFGLGPRSLLDVLPWLGFGGLFLLLWRIRAAWSRCLLLGLGFFYLNLAPVLGFTFLHYTLMNWSTEHLLYLSIIGLIAVAVAGLDFLELNLSGIVRSAERGLLVVVLALMAWKSHAYSKCYLSGETLWAPVVVREPTSSLVQQNYGTALIDHKKYMEAVPYVKSAVELNPSDDMALIQLGQIALQDRDMTGAEAYYRQAMAIAPKTAGPYINLGSLMFQLGRNTESIDFYKKALAIKSDSAEVQYDLGDVLLQSGDLPGAIEHLSKSEELDPKLAMTHENLGVALARVGRSADAIAEFQFVEQLEPEKAAVHNNLGLALARAGHIPEAIKEFQQTLQLDPGNRQASAALAKLQQFEMQHAAPPAK